MTPDTYRMPPAAGTRRRPALGALALLACLLLAPAGAAAEEHPGAAAFAARVAAQHGVAEADLLATLRRGERKQGIIDAMRRPAEAKPWHAYRKLFLTPARIGGGVAFLQANRPLLDRVSAQYGVEPEYIVAILGVETSYGLNTGSYRVLDALVTLAFHYPPRQKYFRGELEKFLTMPQSELPGPREDILGSYAGAMGWGQFMPTSVAAYARDEDGDGRIDLATSLPDITASIANYLARHGWRAGAPVAVPAALDAGAGKVQRRHSETIHTVGALAARGWRIAAELPAATPATGLELDGADGPQHWVTFGNFHVITRYNRSPLYAMAVTELAAAIRAGAADGAAAQAAAAGAGNGR